MEKILNYLNNYFYKFGEFGNYSIVDGKITVIGKYVVGQYIKLQGSFLNDGIYKIESVVDNEITIVGAVDEEYEGYIYSLAIPKQLIELETQVKEFETNNKPSNIQSESFGNYSYNKGTNKSGKVATWKDAFFEDLKPYRKMIDSKRGVKFI